MNENDFLDGISNIENDVVERFISMDNKLKNKARSKSFWIRVGALAACLSFLVIGGVLGNVFRYTDTPDFPENNIISYFAITAYAANGESTDLGLSYACISSTPEQQGNILGVDMPLFHFDIKPSDLEFNEAVYERFDISISYNGTPVGSKDDHILVVYLANAHQSKPYAYSVIGWFTEPTNVVVTITDKESREIVETITVNVKYLADKQEYELKITNLDTEYAKQ